MKIVKPHCLSYDHIRTSKYRNSSFLSLGVQRAILFWYLLNLSFSSLRRFTLYIILFKGTFIFNAIDHFVCLKNIYMSLYIHKVLYKIAMSANSQGFKALADRPLRRQVILRTPCLLIIKQIILVYCRCIVHCAWQK